MKSTESRFRAYNPTGGYEQSYNGALKGALKWATDCAKSVKGYVLQTPLVGEEGEGILVFGERAK